MTNKWMSYRQLDVWQKAMDLAVMLHGLTKQFPTEEKFGVISQIRRSSVSIAANIAEGYGRYSRPDKRHKYVQARGELTEVTNFLIYSHKVGYLNMNDLEKLQSEYLEVHKMLNGLIRSMTGPNPQHLTPNP